MVAICAFEANTVPVVQSTAAAHGLKATFVPKYLPMQAGCGSHMHMSLWRGGQNVMSAGGYTDAEVEGNHGFSVVAESFLAGVLHHLPALMAITTPTHNSHRRVQPGTWSGSYQVQLVMDCS